MLKSQFSLSKGLAYSTSVAAIGCTLLLPIAEHTQHNGRENCLECCHSISAIGLLPVDHRHQEHEDFQPIAYRFVPVVGATATTLPY